jgi:hypothetical protein
MSEQVQELNQGQVINEEDQAVQQDQQTPDTNTVEQKLSELEERYKAEIKGLNKKVSVLAKEKEEAEMAKLSETERAEAEKQKAIKEAEEIKAETVKLRRDRDLAKVLYESGLDADKFGKRIVGEDAEEMQKDANLLKAEIDAEVERRLKEEVTRRFGGDSPRDNGKPKEDLSYAEKVKRANQVSQGRKYY